jgi:predicted ATPase
MLELLLTIPEYNNLFIIGAYRDNEVNEFHSLSLTINKLKKCNVICNMISLNPLTLKNIEEMLADTCHKSKEAVKSLAKICYEKTGGNPFFLNQLLQSLYQENLIIFDVNNNQWIWHLEHIQQKNVTENLVDLMVEKIKQSSTMTQEILQIGACLGNHFTLNELIAVYNNQTPENITLQLEEGLKRGFLLKLKSSNQRNYYQFAHDKIQQAAYSLIPLKKRKMFHLNIGKNLLEKTPPEKLHEKIFPIANHFNTALMDENSFLNEQEKLQIAELNLKAAKIAKAAAAFEPALIYITQCLKNFPNNSWQENYSFTLEC